MEDKALSAILKRAAGVVKDAKLEERLEAAAFQAVVEVLLRAEGEGWVGVKEGIARGPEVALGEAINEFLVRLDLKSHTDRFVAVAYYLLHRKGQLTLNIRHLEQAYTLARETKPKNFSDVAGWCAKRGFFAETGAKVEGLKEWQITKTGEAYVGEELLKKE